jgi:hypothetical protein
MHISFDDLIGKIIQVYLDDLIVYSRNQQDHFDHLKKKFLRCRKFGISLNPVKSIFGMTQGKLLGYIVSDSRISIDPKRVIAIQNIQSPTSKKEIQSFMGKINFVRKFIPEFARMVKPTHNMLKQDRSFSCNDDIEKYFVEVKKDVSYAPFLVKPNFEKDFIIYSYAIEEVIYVILLQKDDQNND